MTEHLSSTSSSSQSVREGRHELWPHANHQVLFKCRSWMDRELPSMQALSYSLLRLLFPLTEPSDGGSTSCVSCRCSHRLMMLSWSAGMGKVNESGAFKPSLELHPARGIGTAPYQVHSAIIVRGSCSDTLADRHFLDINNWVMEQAASWDPLQRCSRESTQSDVLLCCCTDLLRTSIHIHTAKF